jgi:hypothetical protein
MAKEHQYKIQNIDEGVHFYIRGVYRYYIQAWFKVTWLRLIYPNHKFIIVKVHKNNG